MAICLHPPIRLPATLLRWLKRRLLHHELRWATHKLLVLCPQHLWLVLQRVRLRCTWTICTLAFLSAMLIPLQPFVDKIWSILCSIVHSRFPMIDYNETTTIWMCTATSLLNVVVNSASFTQRLGDMVTTINNSKAFHLPAFSRGRVVNMDQLSFLYVSSERVSCMFLIVNRNLAPYAFGNEPADSTRPW